MSDLISRKWLMECVDEGWIKFDTEKDKNTYVHLVRDIAPSAEPEPCDDPRADIYYLAEKIGIHRLYALVVELRGEPEPCKDAVSRQAAIDEIDEWIKAFRENGHKESAADARLIKDGIIQLPSAQPERKKGKWIERWHDNQHVIGDMACSVCGAQMLLTFPRFCPCCGAYMREEAQDATD